MLHDDGTNEMACHVPIVSERFDPVREHIDRLAEACSLVLCDECGEFIPVDAEGSNYDHNCLDSSTLREACDALMGESAPDNKAFEGASHSDASRMLREQQAPIVEQLKEVLCELRDLLEFYSPSWYSTEHHERIRSAIQLAPRPDTPDALQVTSVEIRRICSRLRAQ